MQKSFRFLTGCILFLFLLSFLPKIPVAAASATCEAPEGKGISVMSFNVLNNNNKDSAGNFIYAAPAKREKEIAAMINAYKPDIIGLQEAGTGGDSGKLDWCSALNTDLKGTYAYRSLKDDTGLALDVYRGLIIFYNKSRFTLVSSGGQGYSDPANNRRAFHWVKLKDKNTNTEFFVFNTHWQYDGNQTLAQNQATRVTQQAELAKKVNSLAKNYHFFITGDFNSSYIQKAGSKCDAVAFNQFMQNANYKDGLVEAPEKYTVHANGTRTAIQTSDSGLQNALDHVVYHSSFYTPLKMEKILCRTYASKLSDHDAVLVHFKYKMPSLTVSASEGTLDAFYSNEAYYIDNYERRTTDLPITVKLSGGAIYTDAACTASAGTDLTMKSGNAQTYRPNNILYIKWGGMIQTLHLRSCNINTYANAVFVDKSMTNKVPGSTALYCDKWYGRLVTVGVNGFSNIQDAVNAAQNGFDILVAPGTYSENITISNKSVKLYGQNRTNIKALVVKNGMLEVNTSGRTYETYLTGNITYNVGNQQAASLMVNGFHFTGRTSTAQIYLTGGDASKTLDLRISNNLFNCYTDGAPSNGSVVHGISAVQKTGSIEDNYFHLTKVPTYTDSSGKTVNYTNRGITLRNLKDITVTANYFDGYTGSKMRPFWLSSEVSSGSTNPGYGNVAILGNRFENSYPGALSINNIRGNTTANIVIAGNSYGGEKMKVDFSQTANQTSQNLPTDKTKITFQVHTNDYPNLNITPASPGVTVKKFNYYVTFRSEDGMYIYGNSVVNGTTATYKWATPTKGATASNHYTFKGWMTEKNGTTVANLNSISANTNVYASFSATAHTVDVRAQQAPTCTAPGATGERYCTVCNYVITANAQSPATGHTQVVDPAIAPTCTETGLTEGKHCETCGEVLVARGMLDALGHAPKYADNGDKTHTVTCENCDYREIVNCTFENGECICGAKEVVAPIYDEAVKFSHSLTLENDISINFIGLGSALIGYDSFYLECKVPVYNGNEFVGYETVKIYPVYNGKNYECTLLGITAKMMNDEIEAVFRMTKDGQEYYSRTDVYSVAEYAYGKLDSTKASDTAELKAICANLLRYGSLAQTQFNYRIDALVDAGMTDAHKAFLTDLNTVEMKDYRKQLSDLDTVIVPWKSTTLELGNKVIMCLIANLANYAGDPSELTMRLSYTDAKGVPVTEERPLALYNPDAQTYAVSYDGLRATEMRTIVSAAIYRNGERVSKTVEYSIESYGARSTDSAMQNLCRAMLAYGDSANAFFSN